MTEPVIVDPAGPTPSAGEPAGASRISREPTTPTEPPLGERGAGAVERRYGSGLTRARLRILGWFVVVVAGAIASGLLLQRQALLANLDARLDAIMHQELDELEALTDDVDPATGQPFTSVEHLFSVAIANNVPLDAEAVATFVDGAPYRASPSGEELFDVEEFVSEVSTTRETLEDSISSANGAARYIAQPVRFEGGPQGVFVAVVFTEGERAEVEDAIQVSALVALAVLLAATVAAWVVAGRVLRPVREVTEAARTIGETDLRRRIPVEGDDEVAELAATFNAMLDRLAVAFRGQRAFIDDAGHELRTPITIIQGHLDLLSDDPEERRQTLALVNDELARMNRIVGHLLLLARAERPDFLQIGLVDLGILAFDVQARAQAIDDREWAVVAQPASLIVRGDRERLLQAMLNLVANAAQHTPRDTRVTIGAGRADDGRPMLWVEDDGPGIPEEERERVFGRFSRGGDRGGGDTSGAGLGLSITAAIVEAHGGTVTLDPKKWTGTRFVILLPFDSAEPLP